MWVLNNSMAVPTRWNRTTTRSSRRVSRRPATMAIWMAAAARVRKSLRASAASVGYQRCAAKMTASIAPPNTQAQACLSPKTANSASQAAGPR